MLKYAVFLGILLCSVESQRPWHAGSSGGNRLPQVLPQYIDERIAAEQQTNQGSSVNQTGPANQAGQASQPGPTSQVGPANQGGPVSQTGIVGQAGSVGQVNPTGPANQAGQGTQTATASGSGASGTNVLGNRIGESTIAPAAVPNVPSTMATTNPLNLPVDAHGDVDLVNRIMTWPRDKQPFWYINWQAIQAHRGDTNNNAQPAQTQPNPKSFFAG